MRGTGRYYLRMPLTPVLLLCETVSINTNFHFLLVTSKTVNDQGFDHQHSITLSASPPSEVSL